MKDLYKKSYSTLKKDIEVESENAKLSLFPV